MNLSLSIFFLSLHTLEFVLDGNLHVHITACGIAEHVSFGKFNFFCLTRHTINLYAMASMECERRYEYFSLCSC